MPGVYWGRYEPAPAPLVTDAWVAGRPGPDPYSGAVAGLFTPPADRWIRLSPKYAVVRVVGAIIANLFFWVPVSIAGYLLIPQFFPAQWKWAPAVVGAAWFIWRVIRAGRYARSWAYAERGEDLCITRGLWYKNLTVVPYGRLQIAKVDAGPLDRMLGLATVSLVTASAHSNATIPGLPAAEAERMRDRLIEVGDSLGAGL